MNVEAPDLKQLSAEALRDLLNNLTQAKGFILEQAPDFCQQLVARGMWMPAFAAAIAAAICLALAFVAALSFLSGRRQDWKDGFWCVTAVFGSALSVIAGWAAIVNAYNAIRVYVAPKVFLVEEITRMIR